MCMSCLLPPPHSSGVMAQALVKVKTLSRFRLCKLSALNIPASTPQSSRWCLLCHVCACLPCSVLGATPHFCCWCVLLQATAHEDLKRLLGKAQAIDELESTIPSFIERLMPRNYPAYVHVLRVREGATQHTKHHNTHKTPQRVGLGHTYGCLQCPCQDGMAGALALNLLTSVEWAMCAPACLHACLQIDPQALDDGAGDDGSKLWHQQALVSGAEHTPLGAAAGTAAAAAAGSGASDATMQVSMRESLLKHWVWC